MGMNQYKELGSINDTKVLNSNEQGMRQNALGSLTGLQGNYQNLLKQFSSPEAQALLSGVMNASNQYGAVGQGITNAANAFGNIDTTGLANVAANYDPAAANQALMSAMPGYISSAQNAAAQSLSGVGSSATALAQQATRDAMRASSGELANSGLLYSGAGNQAMLEAAMKPQTELQYNLAGLQSNAQNSILQQLLGAGANQFSQGYETQNSNLLGSAQADIAQQQMAAQAGLQGATSQLDVANSNLQAKQYAQDAYINNLMAQLQGLTSQSDSLSNIANLTQQQWYTPQYAKKAGWMDYLGAATGLATGVGALSGMGSGAGAVKASKNLLK